MAVNNLPPIPQTPISEVHAWRDWFKNLGTYIQAAQAGKNIWAITQGGTGASTAAGAISNLGLGSMSTQNNNSVVITGGSISGITIPYSDVTGLGTMATQNIGVSGTFESGDPTPKTITVVNGIITSIV